MDTTTTTQTTQASMAEQISARFHDDGTCWADDSGVALVDALALAGARSELSSDGEATRHTLPDGSIITTSDGGWDYGYPHCWCWRGAGHREDCDPEVAEYACIMRHDDMGSETTDADLADACQRMTDWLTDHEGDDISITVRPPRSRDELSGTYLVVGGVTRGPDIRKGDGDPERARVAELCQQAWDLWCAGKLADAAASTGRVMDYLTGDSLDGAPSVELVHKSDDAEPTGAVDAYRDDAGVWQYVPDCDEDRMRRLGYEVRTVYVER